jgi:hypothetical protein
MQVGTYEAQQRAKAIELRRKFFKPVKAKPLPPAPTKIEWVPPKPQWMKQEVQFDQHVVESRLILEMLKKGKIDMARAGQRTIMKIVQEVLERFPGITIDQVKGSMRRREIVEARHQCIYAVRVERQDLSYPAIGRWFDLDHTSCLSAYYKIAGRNGNEELRLKHERKMSRQNAYHKVSA